MKHVFTTACLLMGIVPMLTGCRTPPPSDPSVNRPPVGIVRTVNLAERYVVFEAEFRIPSGTPLRLLRETRPVGRLESGDFRRRKFQVADILEGRPRPGDLVEPILPVQPEPAQQTQRRRLGP